MKFFVHDIEVAAYKIPDAAAMVPSTVSSPSITRVEVSEERALIEGHSGTGAVLACGLRGVGLTLFNELAADNAFTAEVGYTEKRGLGLGTRRTGTGVSLSATVSDRALDPAHPFAEGRLVFRQGTRLPEPDGSYLIADFHPKDGLPVPVFVRLQAKAVLELYEQCNAFVQPTAPRKGDESLELQSAALRSWHARRKSCRAWRPTSDCESA